MQIRQPAAGPEQDLPQRCDGAEDTFITGGAEFDPGFIDAEIIFLRLQQGGGDNTDSRHSGSHAAEERKEIIGSSGNRQAENTLGKFQDTGLREK